MEQKIRLAVVGLGSRGMGLLEMVYLEHPDVEYPVVCDVYEDRCKDAADSIEKSGRPRPEMTQDYHANIWEERMWTAYFCVLPGNTTLTFASTL